MTFEQCKKEFPLYKTYIGNYGDDKVYTINSVKDVEDLKNSVNPPLEWNNDSDYDFAFPFLVYEGDNTFNHWYYSAFIVSGYINETGGEYDFYPATYSEDIGWEPFDPNNRYNFNMSYHSPDYELRDELLESGRLKYKIMGNKWMNEQVAFYFDDDKYLKGEIFTTYEDLENFIQEKNKV